MKADGDADDREPGDDIDTDWWWGHPNRGKVVKVDTKHFGGSRGWEVVKFAGGKVRNSGL